MRATRSGIVIGLALALLVPGSAVGQNVEALERDHGLPPVEGWVSPGGAIVLSDEDFCSYVLGGMSAMGEKISPDMIEFQMDWELKDVKKKNLTAKKVEKALQTAIDMWAVTPSVDPSSLGACVNALNQFRLPEQEEYTAPYGPLYPWALEHPVIPLAFAERFGLGTDKPHWTEVAPTTSGSAVTMSGTGPMTSAVFSLDAGDYWVQVNTAEGCTMPAFELGRLVGDTLDEGESVAVYEGPAGLSVNEAGYFWWSVPAEAGCEWVAVMEDFG